MTDFFAQYNYQSLLKAMLERIPPGYDLRDTKPIPTALGPAAWVLEGLYLNLTQVQQQAFIQTAVGEALDMLAVLGNLTRGQATPAVLLGVFNAPVPIGSRFSTINGANSINLTATEAATGPDEGSYYYQMTAESPGTIGNDYAGPILPIAVIPGLTSAQVTEILVPGDDTETDASLRARLITALTDRPFGGNIASYREYIMAIDGVGAVQVYPTWNGGGTVACSILGADFLPASEELIEDVQNAIDPPTSGLGLGLAPIGAQVTITTPAAVDVDVAAALTLSPGYSIGQVQAGVEAAIEAYLLTVRQGWATNTSASNVAYAANVYVSRVTAAIVGVTGVENATDVTLNGGEEDLTLTQTGASQQVPILGTVTLNG